VRFDKPLVAFLIGALATIPQEIYTWILLNLGVGRYSVYQLNSLVITINRPNEVLGILSTFLTGGVISVILYYLLNRIGTDYIVLKSLSTGLLSWIFTEAIFTWLLEGPGLIQHRPISDYFLQSSGSAVFGLVLGFLYKKYLVADSRVQS